MVLGFCLAAYSVIANDSVQTLGTFIASNAQVKWYWLWLAASAVLLASVLYGWVFLGGDVSHGRLASIPFQPVQWYHLLGPAVLFGLTRFGIPVSTTFMVLSLFASSVVLETMLVKSFIGYGVAAVSAYCIWWVLSKIMDEHRKVDALYKKKWRIAQWVTTGFLWFTWLSHDMANIAVFLPRELSVGWLVFMLTVCIGLLGYIFYSRGGKIQHIVLEKTSTRYVRSATIIDLVFAFLLIFFKEWSNIPMSTTWVFVGLLCGREIAIYHQHEEKHIKTIFPMVIKDFIKMMLGLAMSVGVGLLVHEFIIA